MKTSHVYRWTGISGIVLFLLINLEIPLYFVYTPTASGTPPDNIILLRILVDMFVVMGLLAFFSGLREIISSANPEDGWLSTLIFANALAFSIASLVADSIQAGSVWIANGHPVNPTFVGYGGEGALLIYGPINRLIFSMILFLGSIVTFKTNLLPKWTAWLAIVVGLYNLSFIPTLFYMTTPLDFYSVNGWNIPIAAGFFFLWVFVISCYLVRKARR